MPTYLGFLDDAIEEFADSFEDYQSLVASPPAELTLRRAAKCLRNFTLAVEKGLKHGLSVIDPYLLISKPDRGLLMNLRRDLEARAAPTIFCSREPFDTISLMQTWKTLR